MAPRSSIIRKTLVTGALVAGASIGAAGIASAASSSTTSTTAGSSAASAPSGVPTGAAPTGAACNPATMTHRPGGTSLTGTDLQKAGAAARGAVPGASIIRAETNPSGAYPYQVQLKKADGSYVTVELNSKFQAVKTISGFGAGPSGSRPFNAMVPPSSTA
jgi:hypothetical protein